jgi:hypothetical protein
MIDYTKTPSRDNWIPRSTVVNWTSRYKKSISKNIYAAEYGSSKQIALRRLIAAVVRILTTERPS